MASASDPKELTLAELLNTSIVRCQYCNNVYTSPLLLPCLHTFCQQCVTEIVIQENINQLKCEEHNDKKEKKYPKCTENDSRKGMLTIEGQAANNIFTLHCPTCKAQITIDGGQLLDTIADDKDEGAEEKPDRERHNKDEDKIQIGNTYIPATSYKRMKDSIRACLIRDYFMESITRLYRYRNDAGRECAYCKTEDVIAPASSLCLQCGDDVCDSCVSAHRKTRITRDHAVIPYSAIQQGLFDHDIRTAYSIKCDDHPESTMALFCYDCLKVVCKLCRSKKHHGHSLDHLKDATDKMAPEITQVQQGLFRRIPDLSNYIKFLTEQKNTLVQRHSQTIEDIQTQSEVIHRMVDEWKTKVISTLESATSQERNDIDEKIDDINTSKTSMEKSAFFLFHLSNLGKADEKMALYASVMKRYQQLLRTKPKAKTSRLGIAFDPGPTTDQNIRILAGKLGLKHEALSNKESPKSRLPISSLMPAILHPPVLVKSWTISTGQPASHVTSSAHSSNGNNKHPLYNGACYISGIDIKGNMLAAVDRENAKVIIVDMATQNVLKEFTGNGDNKLQKPFDVVFLPSGALAVTDPQASVVRVFDWTGKFILTFEGESKVTEKTDKGREKGGRQAILTHPRGITLNRKGEVVVVDSHQRHCTIHDSNTGRILRIVNPYREEAKSDEEKQQFNDNSEGIETKTSGVHSLKEKKLQTPTEAATANIISAISKTTGPILVDPSYVCVSPEENLVITDAASPNVKILSPDGMVLEESMDYGTRTEESLHPAGVSVDKFGYILLVDTINSRIHLGLPDGQFSDILVSSKSSPDLSHPISVCLNHDGHIVIAQVGGRVNMYKYL